MTRKSPIRHKVRSHKRKGKLIKSFERGKGTRKVGARRSRTVGAMSKKARKFNTSNPTRKRKYRIPLWILEQEEPEIHIVEASDISDATDRLAARLDVDVSDILITMDEDSLRVYNSKKDVWVPNRPWWEEEKDPYEWEK